MPLKAEFETSFGGTKAVSHIIVNVEEVGGEEGWGEVPVEEGPWYSYETTDVCAVVLDKFLVPALLSAGDVEAGKAQAIFSRVRGYNMAKAGLEMALWDLEAKLAGRSLSEYIGGVKSRVESGVSIGIKRSVDDLLRDIGRRLDEGYCRIKIKIKPSWDVNVVREVRRAYPDIPLQVDANAAYDLRRDLTTLIKLDDYGLLMIEQPLDYRDLADHAVLSRKLKTPICLDESIRSIYDLKAAYRLGSCEIVNIKPARVGGISSSKAIHDLCVKLGLGCWVGGMLETGVGRGHLVAVASLPGMCYPNDISASNRYWHEDIVEPEWEQRGGFIEVPRKPGIGVEVIEERIKRYTVWTREYRRERS